MCDVIVFIGILFLSLSWFNLLFHLHVSNYIGYADLSGFITVDIVIAWCVTYYIIKHRKVIKELKKEDKHV